MENYGIRVRQQPWFQNILSPDYDQDYDQEIPDYVQHTIISKYDHGQRAIPWFQNFLPPEYGYGQRNLKSGIGSSQKFHESYKPVRKPLGEVGFVECH